MLFTAQKYTILQYPHCNSKPFSIPNENYYNINGLLLDLSKKDDLFNKVVKLIENPQMRESISRNAYYTMQHLWNPHNAAEKFIQLADSLLQGIECEILDGPCSKAKVL